MTCIGQSPDPKTLIDTSTYRKWETVNEPVINSTGHYVSFIIKNRPVGTSSLVMKSVKGPWELTVEGGRNLVFTNDGRFAVFIKPTDSLFIVQLGESVVSAISNVKILELKGSYKNEVLVMNRVVDSLPILQILNLRTRKIISFRNVKNYAISPDAKSLIILRDSIVRNKAVQALNWVSLQNKKSTNIWTGKCEYFQMAINNAGDRVAFLINDSLNGKVKSSCFYYKLGMKSSLTLFDDQSKGILNDSRISYLLKFSKDGSRIFFATERSTLKYDNLKDYPGVNIWSYLDKTLKSVQAKNPPQPYSTIQTFNLNTNQVNVIKREGDIVIDNFKNDKVSFVWHMDSKADFREHSWNSAAKLSYSIVFADDGKRINLNRIRSYDGVISPEAKYLIYFDGKDYYSYEIALGIYRNVTNGANPDWSNYETSKSDSSTRGIGGWLKSDKGLLVYDKYDIWLLDPLGKHMPRNITNNYGREHNIVFSLGLSEYEDAPISENASLVLSATGLKTKNNGYFRIDLNAHIDPQVLTYDSYVFHIRHNIYVRQKGQFPIKARNSRVYLVSRMSSSESLNYFVTQDFRKFIKVSDVHPEKKYNWYTSEIYTWTTPQGEPLQGILYKPENFDSTRKYPLILNYYEKLSDNLNVCLIPNYSSVVIDIPTYVSNGYLVFTPDILYTIGDPMQGAYNSIVSATHYLSKFDFIDIKRIAIQGFSFGAVQTNYLVANTNLFAAACSASGLSDFISAYGALSVNGYSLQGNFENGGQVRMGGAPWEFPEMYVKNSAIFKANKVTTPLLMMHTTNDGICPFAQALEFFTALRRLGKKVWLLEYTDGRHTIHGKSAVDFDMRMRQFFDHYLMKKAAPDWMIQASSY